MTDEDTTRLCWIDVETTGLEEDAKLLEIGAVVTEGDLTPVAAFHAYAKHDFEALRMNRWCWETHTSNGLLEELRRRSEDVVEGSSAVVDAGQFGALPGYALTKGVLNGFLLDQDLRDFVARNCKGAPLAGASIHFDRRILQATCPRAMELLHYRNVDVSSIRELLRRFRPDVELPPKSEQHRVFADLYVSIESARVLQGLLCAGVPSGDG